jgi:hypothetical protein
MQIGVTIDKRGWAQAKTRPSWTPSEEGRTRRGLPWTPAEDRALLHRVAGAASVYWGDPMILAAARIHGRTSCSIATRVCALKAGIRLAMAAKQAATSSPKKKRS